MSERNLHGERRRRTLDRRLREAKLLIQGALHTDHPIMAHIIPIRRCNLSCAYCNEYDDYSKPVPLETMLHRLDLLGKLKTGIVTISGGEPLLHPELDEIIQRDPAKRRAGRPDHKWLSADRRPRARG